MCRQRVESNDAVNMLSWCRWFCCRWPLGCSTSQRWTRSPLRLVALLGVDQGPQLWCSIGDHRAPWELARSPD